MKHKTILILIILMGFTLRLFSNPLKYEFDFNDSEFIYTGGEKEIIGNPFSYWGKMNPYLKDIVSENEESYKRLIIARNLKISSNILALSSSVFLIGVIGFPISLIIYRNQHGTVDILRIHRNMTKLINYFVNFLALKF
jgi:hypothetical protein